MSGSSSFFWIACLFLLCIGCVEGKKDARQAQIIGDSIRMQDSLQIQLWLDSLSAETDSLQELLKADTLGEQEDLGK
ncbi:MAG: hypothetical protein AAF587_00570 [Bacteroidota bacterium]